MHKHRTTIELPFPSVFLLPRRTSVSSLEQEKLLGRISSLVFRRRHSPRNRIAWRKYSRSSWKNPGSNNFRQLNLISILETNERRFSFERRFQLTGNANGFVGAVVPGRDIHQMHLKSNLVVRFRRRTTDHRLCCDIEAIGR